MILKDRIAVVTGSGQGIGAEIARLFAQEGAKVAVVDLFEERAGAVAEEIKGQGGEAMAVRCDVSQREAVDAMMDQVLQAHGRVDVLVNNAGITRDGLFIRMKPEDWRAVMSVNLDSMFHVTQAVVRPMMKQRHGRIVNIASVVGFTGNPGQVNYSSAKSAVLGFTKSIAKELGSRNITCNAVAPGFIDTDMTRELTEAQQKAILDQIPLGRMGTAKEIAQAVLFLAGDSAEYITGVTIHVNGGMY